MEYSNVGAEFVFGEAYVNHRFAMVVGIYESGNT